MKKILTILLVAFLLPVQTLAATAQHHSGKIYLQVEANGEAWYVNPDDMRRYFLGRPSDAFALMRSFGLGITHAELQGYLDSSFPTRLSGKILLDVEMNGEAYYINPQDRQGYFLGRPADAFEVMRSVGIGITNADLASIDLSIQSQDQVQATGCGSALMIESAQENGDISKKEAERAEFKAVYDCLEESYENCLVNSGILNQHLFTIEYKILGKKNGLCDVQVNYTSPFGGEFDGKSMICHIDYENRRPLFIEINNYPQCEGSLLKLVYPNVINNYRISSYNESMGYSEVAIIWTIEYTVESSLGTTITKTTYTIDDESYKVSFGGESSF